MIRPSGRNPGNEVRRPGPAPDSADPGAVSTTVRLEGDFGSPSKPWLWAPPGGESVTEVSGGGGGASGPVGAFRHAGADARCWRAHRRGIARPHTAIAHVSASPSPSGCGGHDDTRRGSVPDKTGPPASNLKDKCNQPASGFGAVPGTRVPAQVIESMTAG